MIFANSWVLGFLIAAPVLVLLYIFRANQGSLGISISSHQHSFSNFVDKLGYHLPSLLRILAIVLVIILLARPQMGKRETVNKHLGLDIMLAVDTSQSMSALDLELNGQEANRLQVLKHILRGFVSKRPNDRLGLLVFGTKAYTQCPLTLDHGAIIDLLNHIEIGMVGQATAIGDAIAIAVKRMKNLRAKSRILILMTDGQNTAGTLTPTTAMEVAKQMKIKIYTIGIGKEGEVPIRMNTPFGSRIVQQQLAFDEETLVEIAEKTGGQYFRAETTKDLQKIYKYIDKLEKSEVEVKEYSSYVDIYESFLWIVFAILSVELLLANTVFFRIT